MSAKDSYSRSSDPVETKKMTATSSTSTPAPKSDPMEREYRCVVHRLNTEKENADLPISVCLVGKKRKVFDPNKEVVLKGYLIDILRNAVEENDIEIPSESAIYEHSNPIAIAERNFPGFRATQNQEDGIIHLMKSTPMYSVEVRGAVGGSGEVGLEEG